MKKFLFITALALVSLAAAAQVQTPAAIPLPSDLRMSRLTTLVHAPKEERFSAPMLLSLYPMIRSGERVLTTVPGFLFRMM
jgi:hypothetical protein